MTVTKKLAIPKHLQLRAHRAWMVSSGWDAAGYIKFYGESLGPTKYATDLAEFERLGGSLKPPATVTERRSSEVVGQSDIIDRLKSGDAIIDGHFTSDDATVKPATLRRMRRKGLLNDKWELV